MSNQLKLFKKRVGEKDEEIKGLVEGKLKENEGVKLEIASSVQQLEDLIEESIAD